MWRFKLLESEALTDEFFDAAESLPMTEDGGMAAWSLRSRLVPTSQAEQCRARFGLGGWLCNAQDNINRRSCRRGGSITVYVANEGAERRSCRPLATLAARVICLAWTNSTSVMASWRRARVKPRLRVPGYE